MSRESFAPKISCNHFFLQCIAVVALVAGPTFAQDNSSSNEIVPKSRDMRGILAEQSMLRRDLKELESEAKAIQRRLGSLSKIAEVQKELDAAIEQREQAEESEDGQRVARLDATIDSLERRRDRLTMEMDADELQADAGFVSTGTYFVQQTWSQEKSYKRPYHVNVPTASGGTKAERRRFPVLIFLHGNGGNAKRALQGWLRNRKKIASQYVLVFAQGYRESWNIVSERSKADDGGFIEAVVESLSMYDNVDPDDFTIMGSSNGAALVNQLMIERELPGVRNYVSSVSQLNVWQHDGKHFKKKGVDNNYESVATPVTGRRLLNISGVDDRLVPYHGGSSKSIPAKTGKLAFVDAERSTFLWAKQMGFGGKQLETPTVAAENVESFIYLDGDVVHLKVLNEGHGATHAISEEALLEFIAGGKGSGR